MDVRDLVIDPRATVGNKLLLTEVKPYYDYVNGTRSTEVAGYKYTVVLLERRYDKLVVKIPGTQQLELKDNETISVRLDNLKIEPYWTANGYAVRATADRITEAK